MGVVNEEVVITNNVDLAIEGNHKLVKKIALYCCKLILQWGSEYSTCPVFQWCKLVQTPECVIFKCHLKTRQIQSAFGYRTRPVSE